MKIKFQFSFVYQPLTWVNSIVLLLFKFVRIFVKMHQNNTANEIQLNTQILASFLFFCFWIDFVCLFVFFISKFVTNRIASPCVFVFFFSFFFVFEFSFVIISIIIYSTKIIIRIVELSLFRLHRKNLNYAFLNICQ